MVFLYYFGLMAVFCLNGCLSSTIARLNLGYDFRTEILTLQNYLRRNYAKGISGITVANMRTLAWSEALELHANYMVRRPPSVSHNLHFQSTINRNASGNYILDIMRWYSTITSDVFNGRCLVSFQECSAAVMMLNAKHNEIGCAYGPSSDGATTTFMCIYSGGLFNGDETSVFKSGQVCTKCDTEAPFCDNGLCVPCDPTSQNCDCRRVNCSSTVGRGSLNSTSCTCDCQYGQGPNCDEPCQNEQENFYDYDICETIPLEDCENRDNMESFTNLLEFCPHRCSACRALPSQ